MAPCLVVGDPTAALSALQGRSLQIDLMCFGAAKIFIQGYHKAVTGFSDGNAPVMQCSNTAVTCRHFSQSADLCDLS